MFKHRTLLLIVMFVLLALAGSAVSAQDYANETIVYDEYGLPLQYVYAYTLEWDTEAQPDEGQVQFWNAQLSYEGEAAGSLLFWGIEEYLDYDPDYAEGNLNERFGDGWSEMTHVVTTYGIVMAVAYDGETIIGLASYNDIGDADVAFVCEPITDEGIVICDGTLTFNRPENENGYVGVSDLLLGLDEVEAVLANTCPMGSVFFEGLFQRPNRWHTGTVWVAIHMPNCNIDVAVARIEAMEPSNAWRSISAYDSFWLPQGYDEDWIKVVFWGNGPLANVPFYSSFVEIGGE